jgi:hypothetical protein
MSKINLYALPCPALRAGQGGKKFLSRAQDRAGQDRAGQRAGQGKKKCPVTVSDSYYLELINGPVFFYLVRINL